MRTKPKEITPAMQRTLLKIHELRVKKGYMPTLREVADPLNYSLFAIQLQIDALVRLGYLNTESAATWRSTSRAMQFKKTIEYKGHTIPVLGTCN